MIVDIEITSRPVEPEDIEFVAHTSRFLPYDKDRRWFSRKDERVIVEEIVHTPELTVVPTLSTRGHGTIKLYHFANTPPDSAELTDLAHRLVRAHEAVAAKAVWFHDDPADACNRVMLKTYSDQDCVEPAEHIAELGECDVAATFSAFAGRLEVDGFAFLHERMKAGHDDGPVLVAVEDHRIVGAVGPLTNLIDAVGTRMVPPQYYAVHPDHRRRGHGRALWRAAMAWGRRHGAAYKILQAQVGAPAERLYLSEGLTTLGFIRDHDLL